MCHVIAITSVITINVNIGVPIHLKPAIDHQSYHSVTITITARGRDVPRQVHPAELYRRWGPHS